MELLLALIQQNAALLFWESLNLKPILLLGAISQREIAANSTYWKAKVRKDGLVDGLGFLVAKKGGFGIKQNPGPSLKNSPRTYTQISSIRAPIGEVLCKVTSCPLAL
jgi:hypothetical protein